MVAKIQPAAEDIERALVYNLKKMSGPEGILEGEEYEKYEEDPTQTGHILACFNVPETSNLRNEFSRLKMKNRKNSKGRPLKKPVFHMSVNPGENDRKLDERTVVEFVKELMTDLGYKDNPFIIFKHNDIAREHYHVVATRIGQDGLKVNDSFEEARCLKILERLSKKYGFTVGNDESIDIDKEMEESENEAAMTPPVHEVKKTSVEDRKTPQKAREGAKRSYVPPFDIKSEIPRTQQYADAHLDAMNWSFTTVEQYTALMLRRYNIQTKVYDDGIQYAGFTTENDVNTVPVNEKEVGIEALKDVIERCTECSGSGRKAMKYKKAQKERIEKLSSWAAEQSKDWVAYRKLMEKKGVYVVISWSQNNEPFGLTYLDRATKCAWKASETETDLPWLKAVAEEKGWQISRHPRYERAEKADFKASMNASQMKNAASRKQHNGAMRDTGSPSIMQQLAGKKGVGQTRRSNADASKNRERLRKEGEDQPEIVI